MESRALRLLVVDDEDLTHEILRFALLPPGRSDITLAEARSAGEAMEKIKAEDYDLVLLDMRLPLGNEGLDVLADIKHLKPQTSVMMISAWGDIPSTVEAMKRGAIDFIPKGAQYERIVAFKVDEFTRTVSLIADRERFIKARHEEALQTDNLQKKGSVLEDLLAALFASIGGFIEIGRDVSTTTEEIDLVFRNASRDPAWQRESEIILVECKNWHSQRVGKNEFVLFKEKIENRAGRCKLGFLICTERFAETVEKEMLRSSKSNLLIVPIDGDDLRKLVEAKNRSETLRSLVDRALLK
jgi:FixJ family two-component response regulator